MVEPGLGEAEVELRPVLRRAPQSARTPPTYISYSATSIDTMFLKKGQVVVKYIAMVLVPER